MKTNTTNSGSGTLPPSWVDNDNIYIKNKHITRYDHIILPYWANWVEYGENINSSWTYTDWLQKIGTQGITDIGITRLKNDELTDLTSSDAWNYNSDFDNNSIRWTAGNDTFYYYSFYYFYNIDATWTSTQKTRAKDFHLYQIRKKAEAQHMYSIGNIKQPITNRIMTNYVGTFTGTEDDSFLQKFKVGAADGRDLYNLQFLNAYLYVSYYGCYNYTGAIAATFEPYTNGLTGGVRIYMDTETTRAGNDTIPKVAALGLITDDLVATDSSGNEIRFACLLVLSGKIIQEEDILI